MKSVRNTKDRDGYEPAKSGASLTNVTLIGDAGLVMIPKPEACTCPTTGRTIADRSGSW